MYTIKKFLYIQIALFIIIISSSCKKTTTKDSSIVTSNKSGITPTQDLVFCANALYDSKEDIPNIVLSYCCYDEMYDENVILYFLLGQTASIITKGKEEKVYNEVIISHDDNNYKYVLCMVDENNNKLGFQTELWTYGIDNSGVGSTFTNPYGKYVLYCWFESNKNKIIIPREYFLKENGEIHLSVYKINKNNSNEEILQTVKIEYKNDGKFIKLVSPNNSFSGKDGLTDEERFS